MNSLIELTSDKNKEGFVLFFLCWFCLTITQTVN